MAYSTRESVTVLPKLRILIVQDISSHIGGSAVAMQRMTHGLASRNNTVAIIEPSPTLRDRRETLTIKPSNKKVTVYGIRSFSIKAVHPWVRIVFKKNLKNKLRRILDEYRPDVVHIQHHMIMGKNIIPIARQRGIPVLGTNHFLPDTVFHTYIPGIPQFLWKISHSILWSQCLRVYNQLDYVVAPSHTCLRILRDVGLTAPARVISNGIDLSHYRPTPLDSTIYKRYAIQPNLPVFLTVGRVEKDKGIDLIIRAVSLMKPKREFQVVVVGRGKHEKHFRALVRKMGLSATIRFTGYVPEEDIMHLYSAADIYIGAGMAELQGLAVMEAMALKLPVLAIDYLALPELIQNGTNGFLFQNTPHDLAERMHYILLHREEWSRFGREGLRYIQSHSMDSVLQEIEELYREVLGHSS